MGAIYVEMPIDEACEYIKEVAKEGKIEKALVCRQDLEREDIAAFSPKSIPECETIIRKSKTVTRLSDDFMNQLECYTKKQNILNILNEGKKYTVLLIQS